MVDDGWGEGLEEARGRFRALAADHPSKVVTAFNDLFHEEERAIALLELFVTPEAREDWGDFSIASQFFLDQVIAVSTRALRPIDAIDIAYVKVVPDTGVYLSEVPRDDVLGYVNLVWRPELHGWRIHSIGQPVPSYMFPRTDETGTAPRYDTDVAVEPPPTPAS